MVRAEIERVTRFLNLLSSPAIESRIRPKTYRAVVDYRTKQLEELRKELKKYEK